MSQDLTDKDRNEDGAMSAANTTAITAVTYEVALERSKKLEAEIAANPQKFRVLTGDRPTGRLHIGH